MLSWRNLAKYLFLAVIVKRPLATVKTVWRELGAKEENVWSAENSLDSTNREAE